MSAESAYIPAPFYAIQKSRYLVADIQTGRASIWKRTTRKEKNIYIELYEVTPENISELPPFFQNYTLRFWERHKK